MTTPLRLGPTRGVYQPSYLLRFYKDGNPRRPITGVNVRSVVTIGTSKNVNDVAGTFRIVLKDKRARQRIRPMDTVRIRLRGHYGNRHAHVLKGVVDDVRRAGGADVGSATEDTVITGRCSGKYLQETSLFLPVWDPQSTLPTALILGLGDATKKAGGDRPYDIFRYLIRRFTYGERQLAGTSGIPNSRYWLDHQTRFAKSLDYEVPFLQFDEDTMATALKRLEITGFTEAWVDELGRVVYRRPQWDAPASYVISTNELRNWDFGETDVGMATYVEVIPAGDPGIDSGIAQALRAGRAPIPSSYLQAGDTTLAETVGDSFIIDTDENGQPTDKGKRNRYYKLQRRYGVRPQQITSPLIFTQAQAQAQAEGLLKFATRMTKSMSIVIPGCPEIRLGTTCRIVGELEGIKIDRAFYIEQVAHDYTEGGSYDTTIMATHGRDPWEPEWGKISLPKFDPGALASSDVGGVGDDTAAGAAAIVGIPANGKIPGKPGSSPAVSARAIVEAAAAVVLKSVKGMPRGNQAWISSTQRGTDPGSDHFANDTSRAARDVAIRGIQTPTAELDHAIVVLGKAFGRSYQGGRVISDTFQWGGCQVQIIWRTGPNSAEGNHLHHIHIGAHRLE